MKIQDLTGLKFTSLTVLARADDAPNGGELQWICRCDCGKEGIYRGHNLKRGNTKSCGCMNHKKIHHFEGQKFGLWTVLSRSAKRKNYWLCRCDCGKIGEVDSHNLRRSKTVSCGCEKIRLQTKHGQAGNPAKGIRPTREYIAWRRIIDACENPQSFGYKDYGARGIQISSLWREDFMKFFNDMGPRPTPQHSVDRIDNSGNYCKENCRWATTSEQARNRRSNLMITHNGATKCAADWAQETGISPSIISRRHRMGWSAKEILETPRQVRKNNRRFFTVADELASLKSENEHLTAELAYFKIQLALQQTGAAPV